MRQPRLLALLIVLAALLAFGAWRLVRKEPAAALGGGAGEPAVEARHAPAAALEASEVAARQEARADAISGAAKEPSRIRGRVVRGPHALPVAGLEVGCAKQLAPIRGSRPSSHGPSLLPDAPQLRCTSGPDGSFAFEDLDPNACYWLDARGSGWMLSGRRVDIVPSDKECVLAVLRVYVARVLAIDEHGEPLQGEVEYLRYVRVAEPGECESLPVAEALESRRRGIELPRADEKFEEPAGRNYSFASDCGAARLGPFRVLVACAGFQRQDFEFWAFPEGSGADATQFHLQRAAAQTGMLRLIQDCGCEGQSCAHLLEGKLVLEPADAAEKKLEFDLTGLVREQAFGNIPTGDWNVRVQARSGGFAYPAADLPPLVLTVGEAASIVHLPVGRLGAIRWKLRGPGEELARESVPIRPGDGREAEAPIDLWMSAVMRGLEAGPHEFLIDADKIASLEGASGILVGSAQRIHVEVAPGETRTVVVHMP